MHPLSPMFLCLTISVDFFAEYAGCIGNDARGKYKVQSKICILFNKFENKKSYIH